MKESDNIASYKPGVFTLDIDKLNFNLGDVKVAQEDYPAFIHEWCHYLQDITTISSHNAFYLWLRDIVCLTKITCSTIGSKISLPLRPTDYGGYVDKHQKLANFYNGEIHGKPPVSHVIES